jgi:hypothetical protein
MTTPDQLLLHLATETAAELSVRATRDRLRRVNERDHLQPSCSYAARAVAALRVPRCELSTTVPLASPAWPRVGRFDIAFLVPKQKPIAVELKCGIGRGAIAACAWDVLKLAFALQMGVISAGYLMAATTSSEWGRRTRGAPSSSTPGRSTLKSFVSDSSTGGRCGNAMVTRQRRAFHVRSRRERYVRSHSVSATTPGSFASRPSASKPPSECHGSRHFMTLLGPLLAAERWTAGVEVGIAEAGLPWHVTRLGCRAEYLFGPDRPRSGAEAHAAGNFGLERYMHLFALNRGVLLTPFHNMALMSPATTEADVDRHTEVFREAVLELAAAL